jgi:indole-3-glycerol phosphate synthase
MAATYLDAILAHHRERAANDNRDLDSLVAQARACVPPRGFAAALRNTPHLAVISEFKRKSPSKGVLNAEMQPEEMARLYQAGGASCLSVLTDQPHFGGSVGDLQRARSACDLPVLRKDFTVDAKDVCDARIMGADCVLLIAAALSKEQMSEYLHLARQIDIDALVEVHDEAELETALHCGATLVGVNQRDLVTFSVDHERAVRMGSAIPSSCVRVAESGVRGRADAESLRAAGSHAVWVGEHLVTSASIAEAVTELCVP